MKSPLPIPTLLALAAFATLSVTAGNPTWPDPVANHVVPYQSFPITHGPILGNVTRSSARVWIRASEATEFEVAVSESPPFDGAPAVTGNTDMERDGAGWVTVGDLEPNTRYYYAVRMDGRIVDIRESLDDPWPSFRTLPDETSFAHEFNPEGRFDFAFSIGSCQRQRSPGETHGIYANPPAFDTMWKEHRDRLFFHIINGDYTYEETIDGTTAGLEDNYKLYLDRGRSLNRFVRHVPMFTMFNDHEMTDNLDGAGEVGLGNGGYLARDPAAAVWQYYANWANPDQPHRGRIRFGEAKLEEGSDVLHDPDADFSDLDLDTVTTLHVGPIIKGGDPKDRHPRDRGGPNVGVYRVEEVIDEHRLRISPELKATNEAPYSIGTRHYFDRVIGNCHFLFIDTRSERTKFKGVDHIYDEDRSVLGPVQKRWFLDTVKESEADFLFIVSGDPWVIFHSAYHVRGESTQTKGDGFAAYVHEREQLIEALDEVQKPAIILSGDVHQPFVAQITDNVWEFLCSPINSANHPIGTAGLPPLGGWFDSQGRKVKIKWCGGYPDNVHYLRQRHTNYTVVQVNNISRAGRQEGPGYQYLAYDEPQVTIRFHDGYTGDLLYAESISTVDARPEEEAFPKKNRFGHWFKKEKKENEGESQPESKSKPK